MDAVDLLTHDHRKVEKLFSDYQTAMSGLREQLVLEIQVELLAHMEAEERVFYPALESGAQTEVQHSTHQHEQVRALLRELADADIDGEGFDEQFAELQGHVQEHIGDEEAPGGLLDRARQTLSEGTLQEMAGRMEAVKSKVLQQKAA